MAELSPDALEDVLGLVEQRASAWLRNLFPNMHSADIADVLDLLDADDRAFVFELLGNEQRSDVLLEVHERHRDELVEEMEPGEISELVEHLDSDDAADLVGTLDEPVQEQVLGRLDAEDAAELRLLLEYPEDTAGGIMASEYLELSPRATVEDAIDEIRASADDIPDPHVVYVSEPDGPLTGLVTLRQLLVSAAGTPLSTIATDPVLVVQPDLDQEEVARRFRQYDVLEAPVVDASGRMLGVITVDDVVDVLEEEAEEDIGRFAGTGDEDPADTVLHATGRRLPWLLVGLAGGLLAARVLSRFELSLTQIVSLAFFVPVINAMGGNVAMQSASIAVRGLATGPGAYRALGRRVWKEFLVSVLNGLVCGTLIAVVVGLWLHGFWLAFLVGVALFSVILLSTTVGSLVPVLLDRMNVDPALAAGPFVTTANDVLGILVYLSLAELILPLVT